MKHLNLIYFTEELTTKEVLSLFVWLSSFR